MATRVALEQYPPFLLAGLRFAIIALPTVVLIPRPNVQLKWLLGYGFGMGAVEFALLYLAISLGMPSGLSSLVVQSSAPFTVILAGIWLQERPTRRQAWGLGAAGIGLVFIGLQRESGATASTIGLTLFAGLSWAFGNICARQARPGNALHFALWMAVVPPVPLFGLSLLIEGPATVGRSLRGAFELQAIPALLALLYISIVCTLVGTGIWSLLLKVYPAGRVAPISMLVPVVGLAAGAILLKEPVDPPTLAGCIAVLVGVFIVSTSKPLLPLASAGGNDDRTPDRKADRSRGNRRPAED